VVTHQLQVERRTGKVRQSETDVLPLCHSTNIITAVWAYYRYIKEKWRDRGKGGLGGDGGERGREKEGEDRKCTEAKVK